MDLNALMSTMLSADSLQGLGKKTQSSQTDVMNVLTSALPAMLNGASAQANDAKTASGFVGALADHAKDNTSDLSAFTSKVDLADGQKILKHLLGSSTQATTQTAAQSAGVSEAKAGNILSGAAPLLMSLLGQQTAQGKDAASNNASGISSLMTSLLSNTDLTKMIIGMIAANAANKSASSGTAKKTASAKKQDDSTDQAGNLLGSILGLFKG